ncbi:MAG: AAA family ATPase [Candidatus Babeliaceae bacterium]|jgi:AAA+ superfamily predicted ATPase
MKSKNFLRYSIVIFNFISLSAIDIVENNNGDQLQKLCDTVACISDKMDTIVGQTIMNHVAQSRNAHSYGDSNFFVIREPDEYERDMSPCDEIAQFFPQEFPLEFQIAMQCFMDPQPFIEEHKKVPNKFLLYGRPGVGKSYFVELIHKIFQLPLISIKAGDLEDRFYGESSKRITQLLNTRDHNGRVLLIFIDEVDAIAQPRNADLPGVHRSSLNSLLVEIQKHSGDPSVCIFVATNDKNSLDEAFLSRFKQSCIEFKDMAQAERTMLVENLLKYTVIQYKSKAIKEISDASKGLSKRDIAEAIQTADAWLFAHRDTMDCLTSKDVLHFINRNKTNGAISLDSKIKKFVISYLPYVNFTNGAILIILNMHSIVAYIIKHHSNQVNLLNIMAKSSA